MFENITLEFEEYYANHIGITGISKVGVIHTTISDQFTFTCPFCNQTHQLRFIPQWNLCIANCENREKNRLRYQYHFKLKLTDTTPACFGCAKRSDCEWTTWEHRYDCCNKLRPKIKNIIL